MLTSCLLSQLNSDAADNFAEFHNHACRALNAGIRLGLCGVLALLLTAAYFTDLGITACERKTA